MCCTLLTLANGVYAQAQRSADEPTDGPVVEKIVVEETAGAVKIKLDNRWQSPSTGMTVSLPATVSTGADGSIRIRQAATVISVASNTAIELLEGTEPGSPLQRVVQNQGSAFYDIAPQESSRLRVETPYLVAVIKGTEFNVTVAAETSTVALFEGRLQVEAPDVGDVVDLYRGQIAKRHKNDPGITVLGMQDGEPVPDGGGAPPGGGTASGVEGNGDVIAITDRSAVDDDGNLAAGPLPDELAVGLDGDIDFGDGGVEALPDARVDLGSGDIDAGLEANIALGNMVLDVDLGAGLDLEALDSGLALDAGVDIGDSGAVLGLDAGFDLAGGGIDAGLDVGVDLGDTAVDLGMDAGIDLDGGDVNLGLDGDIDLGGTSLDAGLDAGVDLDDGDIDTAVDAGIDLGDTALDAGLDVGVDLGDLDNVLDIDLDLDLDLLGDGDTDSDSDGIEEDEPADLPINPRDLFDLLGL
jgi:hypothetical protein